MSYLQAVKFKKRN